MGWGPQKVTKNNVFLAWGGVPKKMYFSWISIVKKLFWDLQVPGHAPSGMWAVAVFIFSSKKCKNISDASKERFHDLPQIIPGGSIHILTGFGIRIPSSAREKIDQFTFLFIGMPFWAIFSITIGNPIVMRATRYEQATSVQKVTILRGYFPARLEWNIIGISAEYPSEYFFPFELRIFLADPTITWNQPLNRCKWHT